MNHYSRTPKVNIEQKQHIFIFEDFLSRHKNLSIQDLYAWLWEGEFASRKKDRRIKTLLRLSNDVQKAYIFEKKALSLPIHSKKGGAAYQNNSICEYIGLSEKFLRINLAVYSRYDCPLKRLLELENSSQGLKASQLDFKQNWEFIKKISIEKNFFLSSHFEAFERSIELYLAPEMRYTKIFLERYNPHYCIVPQEAFFRFFPEHRLPRA